MKTALILTEIVDESVREFGLPIYRKEGDAGADLYVILDEKDRSGGLTIFPHERHIISSGLKIGLPHGFYGRIVHRSSTEKNYRLRVIEGVIDQGYRGTLFVQVANDNSFPVVINHGDRIAQLVIAPIIRGNFIEVDAVGDSDRGDGGFGSTGK